MMRDAPMRLLMRFPKALRRIRKFSPREAPLLPKTCEKKRLAAIVDAPSISALGTKVGY
jgi:hypothetical protein